MHGARLSSVASLALSYFTISRKDTIFGKSYPTQNVCFDFLYNFCLKHLSL